MGASRGEAAWTRGAWTNFWPLPALQEGDKGKAGYAPTFGCCPFFESSTQDQLPLGEPWTAWGEWRSLMYDRVTSAWDKVGG